MSGKRAKKTVVESIIDTGVAGLADYLVGMLPPQVPESERRRLRKSVHGEIRATVETLRTKLRRRASNEPIDVSRLKVLAACKVLNVPAPKVGQPVDLTLAKKHQRQAVRAYHPDANGGNDANRNEFEAAVKAYEVLEDYNESLTTKKEETAAPTTTQSTQSEEKTDGQP